MDSAINYAREQKRNLKISLSVVGLLVLSILILRQFSDDKILGVSSDIVTIGAFTLFLVFTFSSIMFYSKARLIERIVGNPLVHWKYTFEDDEWMMTDYEEAIISDDGIYYSPAKNRVFTFWSFSSKLQSLKMGSLPEFEEYETMNFYFIRGKTMEGNSISVGLHVPVPSGEESKARELTERLNDQLHENKMNQIKFFIKSFSLFLVILIIVVIIYRNFFL